MPKHLIAPSILAADFTNLNKDIELVNNSDADWFHLDVMDGIFVPNISFGMPIIKAINKLAKKPLDVHLMIIEPDKYIKSFKEVGADILSVHIEACNHLHRTIQAIKEAGMQVGVALNPHTNINTLADTIRDIDLICLMSVNPGFGGQKFIPQSIAKIKQLKDLILSKNANTKIEIDGGVTLDNAADILSAGADVLVAGSTVFKSDNPKQTIADLKSISANTLHA